MFVRINTIVKDIANSAAYFSLFFIDFMTRMHKERILVVYNKKPINP